MNADKTSFYKKYFSKVIWDYDLEKIDLDQNNEVFKWFLERKINYDGLEGIRKNDLLKYYRELKIDPAYKILLDEVLCAK